MTSHHGSPTCARRCRSETCRVREDRTVTISWSDLTNPGDLGSWAAPSSTSTPRSRSSRGWSLIHDADNDALVSAVTVAEVAIKASWGKLEAPELTEQFLRNEGFMPVPFDARHAAALRDLPWHHRDPFDRMLVTQCMVEDLTFLTVDERIRAYAIGTR
ncbi:type II toxin-antitoxin system VapC family toxin [Tsukamurella sputi]|uniref:Type II toxin-antitoxin system VapC family toxin n=1 Tax=Tsukamurella sputi TaxID=2591848 RepID=A0A5C5RJL2_9ACTN|nr:type II toxin-antitoxin system VapC family toxin [Tsukamurella sputi]TWS22633.1 type II toxin-antitoxin system VapC family toxin [Tsukamurella sputi]